MSNNNRKPRLESLGYFQSSADADERTCVSTLSGSEADQPFNVTIDPVATALGTDTFGRGVLKGQASSLRFCNYFPAFIFTSPAFFIAQIVF